MRTKRPARRGETSRPRVLCSRNMDCSVRVLYDAIGLERKEQDSKTLGGKKNEDTGFSEKPRTLLGHTSHPDLRQSADSNLL